jgi:hypothetical protein
LHAERIDDEKVAAALVVEGVEDDADPVIRPRLVAVGEVGAYRGRIRIMGAESDVKAVRVVHHEDLGLDRCRGVFAGSDLEVQGHRPRLVPDRLVEDPVDGDTSVDSRNLVGGNRFLGGQLSEGQHRKAENRQGAKREKGGPAAP